MGEMLSPIGNLVSQLLELFKDLPRFTSMLTSTESPSKVQTFLKKFSIVQSLK